MRYQLADLKNGQFGEIFDNFRAAVSALLEAIEEDASKFFFIVHLGEGEL